MRNSIGQFICALRRANGMTQQEVADRLNVSNKAVSRWERDECAPDISLLPALAELLGVTCDELLKGERISNVESAEKKEAKVEKQVRSLISRALSNFKALIWISMALIAVGVICAFGISYGFYRPILGFALMLLFEIAGLAMTAVALTKARAIKIDNELFEMASEQLKEGYDDGIAGFSFHSLFAAFSAIALSLPLLFSVGDYVNSVISIESYMTIFLLPVLAILVLAYICFKKPYFAWIKGGEFTFKLESVRQSEHFILDLAQLSAPIIASILFVIAPYFNQREGESVLFVAVVIAGLAVMLAGVVYFVVYLFVKKQNRKHYLLDGIRNLALLPSALFMANFHSVAWTYELFNDAYPTTWVRTDIWTYESLLYAIGYCLAVVAVFAIIKRCIKPKK